MSESSTARCDTTSIVLQDGSSATLKVLYLISFLPLFLCCTALPSTLFPSPAQATRGRRWHASCLSLAVSKDWGHGYWPRRYYFQVRWVHIKTNLGTCHSWYQNQTLKQRLCVVSKDGLVWRTITGSFWGWYVLLFPSICHQRLCLQIVLTLSHSKLNKTPSE